MKNVFENTSSEINGKRDRVILYSYEYFQKCGFVESNVSIAPDKSFHMGITEHMCGKSYEIFESYLTDERNYVILIDSGGVGIIKKSLGAWAVERVVSLSKDPEYYV